MGYILTSKTRPRQQSQQKKVDKQAEMSRKRLGKWLQRVLFGSLSLFLISWIGIVAAGEWLIDDAKLAEYLKPVDGRVKGGERTYVSLQEMPDYVWEAFVSIEDHRFSYHFGIDPVGIGRAIWVDLNEGKLSQGGSTITMQLARNLFLTHEKSVTRKLKEMVIAINLERMLTKEEILEMYLNYIYFGHGQYGIESAANWYFGKSVSKEGQTITLGEAALLAALPKAPELYSPVKDWDKAMRRQAVVLNRMVELGYITESEKADVSEHVLLSPQAAAMRSAS
ncbi:transglycosylase domain-containing protein [Brevibacillus humidisoli]|uniref:transglycosylase domain-containing protein n=1 Tax=Brevibacillus humidisoli TaxID=2895522 RepID=UPI001E4B91D1|nr:transglycosylase domain-containing protein [Brevibacillus humidisoli]UFJ42580.1 transglycosylase domain-containing protein [Brevibacillus humidisoli]